MAEFKSQNIHDLQRLHYAAQIAVALLELEQRLNSVHVTPDLQEVLARVRLEAMEMLKG